MKLSEKKREKLYGSIADNILDARIKIKNILMSKSKTSLSPVNIVEAEGVDNILSNLMHKAGIDAINILAEK